MTLDVVLGELPEDEQLAELGHGTRGTVADGRRHDRRRWGSPSPTSRPEQRTQFSLPEDAKGVVITEVAEGSTAAEESLKPGDLIVEVGQEEVELAARGHGARSIRPSRRARSRSCC